MSRMNKAMREHIKAGDEEYEREYEKELLNDKIRRNIEEYESDINEPILNK